MGQQQGARVEASPSQFSSRLPENDSGAVGALFVSGRQHSGNTAVTCMFELVPNCFAVNVEASG